MSIKIVPVRSRRERMKFIKLPWKIYKGDKFWVPPLISDQKKLLDQKKNPFYKHSEVELFLAMSDGEPVGRIAAIVNHNHNRFHNEKVGFFGFFECIDNYEVAEELLNSAKEWLRQKGMEIMRGPANPSSNDTWGLLLEGFDSSPVIMMTYNPPYYLEFMERYGLRKSKDLYAYFMDKNVTMPEKFHQIAEQVARRENIRIRNLNLKDFKAEVERIKYIYNNAWARNWGFVPMTDEEFDHLAKDLKPIVDPDLVFIAEVNGEPAGFSLTLPDYNQALRRINGRLFPFGLVKLLWYSKKIDMVRVLTLGVIHKYQKLGIASVFYLKTYEKGIEKGYYKGEFSWILEDNVLMNRALKRMGAKIYKKYRIYEMEI